MITYETVLEAMQNAQQANYGHAYMTINWETEEVTWGMCGNRAYFPENENLTSETRTWLSPMVSQWNSAQGNTPVPEPELRQLASQWVYTLSQFIPPDVWERLYMPHSTVGN